MVEISKQGSGCLKINNLKIFLIEMMLGFLNSIFSFQWVSDQ